MFITFKKWNAIYVGCIILFVCLFAVMATANKTIPASNFDEKQHIKPVLIIDPGHGGEDGGAVGQGGTIESQINLSIALKATDLARFLGWKVSMTRNEDISIHDANAETLREKKVSDLKNRVALCESIENGILISIHQNSFPGASSVRGAQVFYNKMNGSNELADCIQKVLNLVINSDYPKTTKAIGEKSYLMSKVSCPAVLVECGFLSNSTENQLLTTENHQKKIALALISPIICTLEN